MYFSDRLDVENERLVIYDMNDEDSGEWKCIAENEVGSAEESENIYVQTIPDIIQKKQREHLKEFETLNLECLIARVSLRNFCISFFTIFFLNFTRGHPNNSSCRILKDANKNKMVQRWYPAR